MAKLVHMQDIRLKNNAGISYPVCWNNGPLRECNVPVTSDKTAVTCPRCKQIYAEVYAWAGPWPAKEDV